MIRIVILVLLVQFAVQSATSEIIPPDRVTDWTGLVGVRGGIPNRTSIFVNCKTGRMYDGTTNLSYKCNANGVVDDSAIINSAIAACLSNYVVYLPAGTYLINNYVYSGSKSYFTLRGDGRGTILRCASPNDAMQYISFGQSYWQNTNASRVSSVISGLTKGSTNIVLINTNGSASNIIVGMRLLIDQLNSTNGYEGTLVTPHGSQNFTTSYDRPTDGSRCIAQIFSVTAINNVTNLTVWPPVDWNFSNELIPQASQMQTSGKYVGLEDFSLIGDTNVNKGTYMVYWTGMENSWIKGVESAFAKRWHIRINNALFCEFRELYVHHASSYTVGSGYAFEMSQSTHCLLENSIFWNNYVNIMLEAGDTGCVVGYNYITGSVYSPANYEATGGLNIHVPHPVMCLWEGNISPSARFDHIHGSSSHQTLFRNYLAETNPVVTMGIAAVDFNAWQLSNSVVGNVLGSSSRNYTYQAPTNSYSVSIPVIYQLGFPHMGNRNFVGATNAPFVPLTNWFDLRVPATTLRHGNYDYATSSTIWDGSIADHSLQSSMYLASKPSWWDGNPWPPIGPDLSPMVGKIPAQTRYENLLNPVISPNDLRIVINGKTLKHGSSTIKL